MAAALLAVIAVAAPAQGCNAMSGSLNCGGPIGFLPGVGEGGYRDTGTRRGGSIAPMSTLGGDLTGTSQPGTIGAITFGRDGRKCSGMFRSVNC
ncbi:MAG: hypothetical protein AB7V13_10770 [Pseudorhodoplanes sp.]